MGVIFNPVVGFMYFQLTKCRQFFDQLTDYQCLKRAMLHVVGQFPLSVKTNGDITSKQIMIESIYIIRN